MFQPFQDRGRADRHPPAAAGLAGGGAGSWRHGLRRSAAAARASGRAGSATGGDVRTGGYKSRRLRRLLLGAGAFGGAPFPGGGAAALPVAGGGVCTGGVACAGRVACAGGVTGAGGVAVVAPAPAAPPSGRPRRAARQTPPPSPRARVRRGAMPRGTTSGGGVPPRVFPHRGSASGARLRPPLGDAGSSLARPGFVCWLVSRLCPSAHGGLAGHRRWRSVSRRRRTPARAGQTSSGRCWRARLGEPVGHLGVDPEHVDPGRRSPSPTIASPPPASPQRRRGAQVLVGPDHRNRHTSLPVSPTAVTAAPAEPGWARARSGHRPFPVRARAGQRHRRRLERIDGDGGALIGRRRLLPDRRQRPDPARPAARSPAAGRARSSPTT